MEGQLAFTLGFDPVPKPLFGFPALKTRSKLNEAVVPFPFLDP
jgi:hypothetical protein